MNKFSFGSFEYKSNDCSFGDVKLIEKFFLIYFVLNYNILGPGLDESEEFFLLELMLNGAVDSGPNFISFLNEY